MALEKMTGSLPGIKPGLTNEANRTSPGGVAGETVLKEDFKKALGQFAPSAGVASGPVSVTGALEKLKFSNHAVERMRSRGIGFSPDDMKSIERAVAKAAAKGSKDTLVLAGENALIVSVKNNTVVTVMDRAAMKDNVFTNIDSTVVV